MQQEIINQHQNHFQWLYSQDQKKDIYTIVQVCHNYNKNYMNSVTILFRLHINQTVESKLNKKVKNVRRKCHHNYDFISTYIDILYIIIRYDFYNQKTYNHPIILVLFDPLDEIVEFDPFLFFLFLLSVFILPLANSLESFNLYLNRLGCY